MIKTILFTAFVALAACGTSKTPSKGSSAKGAGAKDAGQKSGGTAQGDKSMAMNDGSAFEGVTCDDSFEGVAWCDDDHTIVFCSQGTWWALDCGTVGGDVCGEEDGTVDCYAIQ